MSQYVCAFRWKVAFKVGKGEINLFLSGKHALTFTGAEQEGSEGTSCVFT